MTTAVVAFLASMIAIAAAAPTSPVGQAPATNQKDPSSEAQAWFERGLALDTGASGDPKTVEAFAAMRRAAELGHPEAAFNVAVMMDSGRGTPRDEAAAAIWYARAAARGVRRAAYNLGQMYESGEGVPENASLARAWFADSGLPAARERSANLRASKAPSPGALAAPELLYPANGQTAKPEDENVDLVWTCPPEPGSVRFFVELQALQGKDWRELWSGFVNVSAVSVPFDRSASTFSWRVSAVSTSSPDYAVSMWSTFRAWR